MADFVVVIKSGKHTTYTGIAEDTKMFDAVKTIARKMSIDALNEITLIRVIDVEAMVPYDPVRVCEEIKSNESN